MLQDLSPAKNHGKTMISENVYPGSFLSCYDLHHSRSFHFIFILLLLFHKVLPSGSCKVFAVPNRLVEEHRERMRMDGEEEQEIEITLPPIKRRRTVFPKDSRGS